MDRFLSTPSGWRATCRAVSHGRRCWVISIHALRVEGDLFVKILWLIDDLISIHALRVEGDAVRRSATAKKKTISIHALRVEGDLEFANPPLLTYAFLSTPSGWRATRASTEVSS